MRKYSHLGLTLVAWARLAGNFWITVRARIWWIVRPIALFVSLSLGTTETPLKSVGQWGADGAVLHGVSIATWEFR